MLEMLGATKLEEAVQGMLDRSTSVDDLVSVLDITRDRLGLMQEEFRRNLGTEAPVTRVNVAREIEAVEQSFADYFLVLDSCSGYLHAFDTSYLESTRAGLPLAIARLNLDLMRFQEAVMAERGPTTHPGLNHLHVLSQLLQQSSEGDRESLNRSLEEQKGIELVRCQSSLASLEQEGEEPLLEPFLRNFYEAYAALLEEEPEDLSKWIEQLLELGKLYRGVDVIFLGRRYANGPTPVTALNLVINSAWLLTQSAVELELVLHFLDQAEAGLDRVAASHQQFQLGLSDDDASRTAAEAVSQGFDTLYGCLAAYREWLEVADPQGLDALFQQASAGAIAVESAFQAVHQLTLRGSGSICPICGVNTEVGQARCRQCGASLKAKGGGSLEGTQAVGGLASATRLNRLLESAERVMRDPYRADHPGLQALAADLEEMDSALSLARQSYKPIESISGGSPEQRASLDLASREYAAGLDAVSEGLDLLQEFSQEPSIELLDGAREKLTSAVSKLEQAQKKLAPLAR